MELTEIKEKKKHGDYDVASQMLGITKDNARHAFKRIASKYHSAVCNALEEIITQRENLIKKA